MYNIQPTITKEFILKRISEEQIFDFYLHHGTIELRKKIYTNTLRADSNPDCSYDYGNSGDLMFRDFALAKSYSCVDIVKEFYRIDYHAALRKIAIDFKLISEEDGSVIAKVVDNWEPKEKIIVPKTPSIIQVKKVEWNDKNLKYWKEYYFKTETLNKFKVNPISHFWITKQGETKMYYARNSYTYYHEFNKVHRRTILNLGVDKAFKWIKNTDDNIIQCYQQLPKTGDLLVLSKSYKDCMVYFEEGVNAVAPNAEGISFKPEVIQEFKQRFKRVVLQIDANTQLALENSIKLSNLYQVPAIYLPEKLNEKCKDISGVRKDHGVENTAKLIKELFNL